MRIGLVCPYQWDVPGGVQYHVRDLARTLRGNEQTINDELLAVQGSPVDIGGYYRPDREKVTAVMRPSKTFNEALASLA